MRICIVAEHASYRFGGEAVLPLHYFSRLRARNIEAWLIVHERTRAELSGLFPDDIDRILFIRDKWFHRLLYRASLLLPRRISENTIGLISQLLTQSMQRRVALDLVRAEAVDVIHQPIPVSPRFPSLMANMGAPVVIGPMNGGMEYPAAFKGSESLLSRASIRLGRQFSNVVHSVLRGKKLAAVLLVANERTRLALPSCIAGKVIEIAENGVDLKTWSIHPGYGMPISAAPNSANPDSSNPEPANPDPTASRFIFVGRLVDWKRVDVIIEALALVPHAELQIVGDGSMRVAWQQLAERLGVQDRILWSGWLPQQECAARMQSAAALVLPSIYECGGAVVLEAMATGSPVIATRWGGPADYLDESCGILVDPASHDALIRGFAAAMNKLAASPQLRRELGKNGKKRVEQNFDWEKKIDRMLEIYEAAISENWSRLDP